MVALLAACAGDDGQTGTATITGALTYRERIALPPGASARVTLSEVSAADRPVRPLREQVFDLAGRQVPIPFALVVEQARLEPRGRYALRGMIVDSDGRLLWTTDTAQLVDPAAAETDLGLLVMVRVPPDPAAEALQRLRGGEWVVEDIARRGIIDSSRLTLVFGDDGRLSGRAGCNSYSAPYATAGDGLTVGLAMATLRACNPALDNQERAFLRLLGEVRRFRFSDTGALILETASGETITARR